MKFDPSENLSISQQNVNQQNLARLPAHDLPLLHPACCSRRRALNASSIRFEMNNSADDLGLYTKEHGVPVEQIVRSPFFSNLTFSLFFLSCSYFFQVVSCLFYFNHFRLADPHPSHLVTASSRDSVFESFLKYCAHLFLFFFPLPITFLCL